MRLYPAQEILPDEDQRRQAVERLHAMLEAVAPNTAAADRQQKLEAEYDLLPFEEFLRLTEEEAAANPAPGRGKGKAMPKLNARVRECS